MANSTLDVATSISRDLSSEAFQEIGRVWGVEDDLEKLRNKIGMVMEVLLNMEGQDFNRDDFRSLLQKVKDVLYEAEDLLGDLSVESRLRSTRGQSKRVEKVRNFFSSSNHLVLRVMLAFKLRKLRRKAVFKSIESKRSLGRGTGTGTHLGSEMMGRERERDEIRLLLNSKTEENISVVAIVGDTGVEKTTLARYLFNDETVLSGVDFRWWLTVSEHFNIENILDEMLYMIGVRVDNLETDRKIILLRQEIKGRAFFLVLDDLSDKYKHEYFLLSYLLKGGATGSKILITTQSEAVTKACLVHSVYSLTESEKASTGEKVTVTYDDLPKHLKRCFAFCSIFPCNSVINKATLIDLWIAEGLIEQLSDGDFALEAVAHEYFMQLLANNFFQVTEYDGLDNVKTVKMDDSMHNLACRVEKGDRAVLGDNIATNADVMSRHLYYKSNSDLSITIQTGMKNVRLRTLVSIEPNIPFVDMTSRVRLRVSDFNKIVSSSRYLRALTIHNTDMKDLPKSLCKLKQLWYLDISYNKLLESLPNSIERLQNLVTLKVIGCHRLKDLPGEIRKLATLRNLDVGDYYCGLDYMPSGLGQLASLHNLNCFIVGVDKYNPKKCANLGELRSLIKLRGKLTISFHCFVENAAFESKAAEMDGKQFLEDLTLCWKHVEGNEPSKNEVRENHQTLLEGLQPSKNLQRLCISSFKGEIFPTWMMTDIAQSLPKLAVFDIFACDSCKDLPPLGLLPLLHTLHIDGLRKVESLDHTDYGTSSSNSMSVSSFRSLLKLSIMDCPNLSKMPVLPNLEELSLSNVNAELLTHVSHCGLKRLMIRSIQFLKSLPESWFEVPSSLEKLWIQNCPSLTSLSVGKGDSIAYISNKYEVFDPSINDNDNVMQQREGFRTLRILMIDNLPALASLPNWLFHVTTLEKLSLNNCSNLYDICDPSINDNDNVMQQQGGFRRLRVLMIDNLPALASLPNWLFHVTKLEKLSLNNCSNLMVSADHVGHLASLNPQISGCPNLNVNSSKHMPSYIPSEVDDTSSSRRIAKINASDGCNKDYVTGGSTGKEVWMA